MTDFETPQWMMINGRLKEEKDPKKQTNKYHIKPKPNTSHLEAISQLPEGDYTMEKIVCTDTSDWFFDVEGKKMGHEIGLYLFTPIY